jgi:putative ABC transport system permease protein
MNLLGIKQAFRNLKRNKIYTAVNIIGLGVSSAFIILVILYVRHAATIDKFSPQTKNIYRVELTDLFNAAVNKPQTGFLNDLLKTAAEKNQITTPVTLAGDLKKNFTAIKAVTRFAYGYAPVIRVNNQSFKEDGKQVAEVDANFFAFMGLSIVQGNASKPFENNNSAVLSESTAKKYFGKTNPIGQTFSSNEAEGKIFTVSAVAKDFPGNSSLHFDIMTLVEGSPYYAQQLTNGTNSSSHITLLELEPGTDLASFQRRINAFGNSYFNGFVKELRSYSDQSKQIDFKLMVRPYAAAHYNTSFPWPYYTDLKSLIQLSLLALIALVIACVNYVLLSLSRVAARSQEAGIRKTMGAGWKQIIRLFLTETQVMVSFAVLAGFVIAVIALPYFNSLTNVNILPAELFQGNFLLIAIALSILLSLIAGIYPALKMAGINPMSMLRKHATYKLNPVLSKVFLTLQYTSCIVLIVFAIVIARQMSFMYNTNLGFDKEQVLFLENPFRQDISKSIALRDKIKNYATSQVSIADFTGVGHRFAKGFNMNGHVIDGKREYVAEMVVDYNYLAFNKIPIVKGRDFSPDFKLDTSRQDFPKEKLDSTSSGTRSNIVVNETLYKMLGSPSLGEINRPMGSIIIGVCKDYYYMGAAQKIGPAYHVCNPGRIGYFMLKIGQGQSIAAVMDKLKPAWNNATNNEPFSYSFLDEDVKVQYESLSRWMSIINTASWLAIFIACLGLFGLSAVTAVNKTKEIGIRKVLGAGMVQLFTSLNKGTFLIILLSIAIAIPVAIYISKDWLESFANRIDLHWSIFIAGGLIGIASAFIAVSFHTIKASKANPAESLRTE